MIDAQEWEDLVSRDALGHASPEEQELLAERPGLWRGTLVMLQKRVEAEFASRREDMLAAKARHELRMADFEDNARWRKRATHYLTRLQARQVEVKRLIHEAGQDERQGLLDRVSTLEADVADLKARVR